MSARVYPRRFDYDEARARRAAGETINSIAREYGVHPNTVRRVVVPGEMERMDAAATAYMRSGRCVDCGGSCSRYHPRCRPCSVTALAISVRPDELYCSSCRQWKQDDDFPHNATVRAVIRRGRHSNCRACQTITKRAYRERTKQPCSHGCGTLVLTADRRYPDKPLECAPCAIERIHRERRQSLSV